MRSFRTRIRYGGVVSDGIKVGDGGCWGDGHLACTTCFEAIENKVAGIAGYGDEVAAAGGKATEGYGGNAGDGDESGGRD